MTNIINLEIPFQPTSYSKECYSKVCSIIEEQLPEFEINSIVTSLFPSPLPDKFTEIENLIGRVKKSISCAQFSPIQKFFNLYCISNLLLQPSLDGQDIVRIKSLIKSFDKSFFESEVGSKLPIMLIKSENPQLQNLVQECLLQGYLTSDDINAKDDKGQTLLDRFFTEKVDYILIRELILKGGLCNSTNIDIKVIDNLLMDLSKEKDNSACLLFLSNLFQQNRAPVFSSLANNFIVENIRNYFSNKNSKSCQILDLYEKYYHFGEKEWHILYDLQQSLFHTFHPQNISTKKALNDLKIGQVFLKNHNINNSLIPSEILETIQSKIQETQIRLDEINQYVQLLKKTEPVFDFNNTEDLHHTSYSKLSSQDVEEFLYEAVMTRDWNFVDKLLIIQHSVKKFVIVEKSLYHFLLDKIIVSTSIATNFEGGHIPNDALALLESLKKIKKDLINNSTMGIELDQIISMLDSLNKCLSFVALEIKVNNKIYYDLVMSRLKSLTLGETLLLPFGSSSHAICIAITLLSEDKCNVKIFNTGEGLNNHHCINNKFQTFIAYTNVSLESIIESVPLSDFIAELKHISSKTTDDRYELFHELCKTGQLCPPSTNPMDYEQPQMQNTCSAQCLMAFIRNYLITHSSEHNLNPLGVYKYFKAHLFTKLGYDRLPLVEEKIKIVTELQIQKYQQDILLSHLASQIDNFKMIYQQFAQFFKQQNQEQFSIVLEKMPDHTNLDRYMILRQMHIFLSKYLQERPEALADLDKIFNCDLAFTFLRMKKNRFNQLARYLDELKVNNQWNRIILIRVKSEIDYLPYIDNWLGDNIPTFPELSIDHPFIKILAPIIAESPDPMSVDDIPLMKKFILMGRKDIFDTLKNAVAYFAEKIQKKP